MAILIAQLLDGVEKSLFLVRGLPLAIDGRKTPVVAQLEEQVPSARQAALPAEASSNLRLTHGQVCTRSRPFGRSGRESCRPAAA